MNDASFTPRVIESGVRLSQSILWRILTEYYSDRALDAWKDNTVPYHITSNPSIAHAYAQLIFAFQQDLATHDQAPPQPLPIVELGAGSGAFAFHFLRQFEDLRTRAAAPVAPYIYVMTDFVPATVDGWQRHPQLTDFVDEGVLDFACFDPLTETALTLRHSGRVLSPAQPSPLAAIANYVFDSLPQDLFGVEDGRIFEIAVNVLGPPHPVDSADTLPALPELDFEYVYKSAASPYYDDAEFERVLRSYADLHGEVVRFPLGALTCCRVLRGLAGNNLLLASADHGFAHAEDLHAESTDMLFNIHDGAFSMPVNFHAVGEYLCYTRGDVLRPPRLHRSICVTAFTTEPAAQRQAVRAAYSEHFARFGIDDAGSLTYWLTQERNLPRELVVSLLRFTRHDPLVLKRCLPSLNDESERWGDAELDVLVEEIAQVWANYYDQGDRYNLPFELGVFMERLHRPAQAIFYYGEALRYYGDTPETLFNLATCYHRIGEDQAASAILTRAAALDLAGPPVVQRHYRRRIDALRAAIQQSAGAL